MGCRNVLRCTTSDTLDYGHVMVININFYLKSYLPLLMVCNGTGITYIILFLLLIVAYYQVVCHHMKTISYHFYCLLQTTYEGNHTCSNKCNIDVFQYISPASVTTRLVPYAGEVMKMIIFQHTILNLIQQCFPRITTPKYY